MLLTEVLKGLKYKYEGHSAPTQISCITADSRTVRNGAMFVAFRGYAADGYRFIGEAIKRGAGVVVAEKDFDAPSGVAKVIVGDTRDAMPVIANNFYGHPSEKMKAIGVTGTNGKTTITYIIESILKAAGKEPGVIGTINYRIDGRVFPAKNTTPGPLELQDMLAEIAKSPAPYAVMEVSSHALDQRRVDGVLYDVAIFTNVTPEHLDYHKTLEEYFKAKAKILGKLKNGGIAILNTDDSKVASLKNSIKNKVVAYGLNGPADISAKNIKLAVDNSNFDIVTPGGTFNVTTRLIGRHNVSNILAAAAACEACGIGREAMKAGIEGVLSVPGRLERIECGQPFKVFVDFAHTEDALANVLGLLEEASCSRIITVFGCGGDRDKGKRPMMGKVACKLSGHVIITSDNPRFEEPSAVIGDIIAGIRGRFSNYEVEPDRRLAIEKALSLAGEDSIVIIAGKGHEKGQIVKDKVLPFDDCEVARELLAGKAREVRKR